MIDILILMLKPMMYFLWNPLKYFYLLPLVIIGFIADVVMNNTVVPFVLGHSYFEQWTFSTRLETLCVSGIEDQQLYIEIAKKINRVCPTHDHIKAVL